MDKSKVYEPRQLFSDAEIDLLRMTFGGTDNLNIKLLRKFFLPTLIDPENPEEYISNDFWMDKDWSTIPNEEVKSIVLARQDTMKHVLGTLIRIKTLANSPKINPEEIAEKQKKDSSK